jgi:hypothetical protein
MIRAIAETDDGSMLILLGITEGNVKRLKEGKPISISLGELLVQAMKDEGERPRGDLKLAISYQRTHVEVVKEWLAAGIPIDEDMLDAAAQIDATM